MACSNCGDRGSKDFGFSGVGGEGANFGLGGSSGSADLGLGAELRRGSSGNPVPWEGIFVPTSTSCSCHESDFNEMCSYMCANFYSAPVDQGDSPYCRYNRGNNKCECTCSCVSGVSTTAKINTCPA